MTATSKKAPGAKMDIRSNLTHQFLIAARLHARSATEMQSKPGDTFEENDIVAYRGFVTSAIMQSVAALECEIWDVMVYGPGHHLGSPHIEIQAREFLAPLASVIKGQPVLKRYEIVLHLLRKENFDQRGQTWKDGFLVVELRNALMHYKSRWGEELEELDLIKKMKEKQHQKPCFMKGRTNFFPYECLSADCASWAVRSCVAFLDAFYRNLGFADRLASYRARLM